MPAPPSPFGFVIPEHLRGSMTAYNPTFREVATDYMRSLFSDDREGQRKAERLSNVLETVTPFGFATGIDDAKEAIGQGDWATAGMMGAMAMVPGPARVKTGWTFKDVGSPNKLMGKGDWAKRNRAVDNQDWIETELPIRSMTATQESVNPDYATYKGNSEPPLVIKKNGQYFVQDGHHRLSAQAAEGKQTAKVRLVDLDGDTQTDFPLLDRMNAPKIRAYHGSPHSFNR